MEPTRSGWSLSPAQRGFLAMILLALVGLVIYSVHQRNVAGVLAQQTAQMSSALNDQHAQMDALNNKLNSMMAAQQAAAEQQAARVEAQKRSSGRVAVARRKADDARWKKVQESLDDTNKKIGDTQADLTNAKNELGSSIARTHDELVVLQRKGERSYYEFDLNKSKQFSKAGPVGVSLRKANTKHDYADLELTVDDARVQQKHVNLYQPVMFYAGDTGAPLELVINSISKNHIHGYISMPKYRQSDLAAMSAAAQQTAAAQNNGQPAAATSQPPARRKLSLPPE
jgi:outer membrane murein-binding lipoprotein Lpp